MNYFVGFGRYNLKIAALGAAIYTNAVASISSTGFVLPAATCDFEMTTIEKGRIAIASVLGKSPFFSFLFNITKYNRPIEMKFNKVMIYHLCYYY